MRETEFRQWLAHVYVTANGTLLDERSQLSRFSNCRTVERYEGDLDEHYRRDRLESLLERLSYSMDDRRAGVPPRHSIPIDGNVYNGTSTLRSAVKLYRRFCEDPSPIPSSPSPDQTRRARRPRRPARKAGDWPQWPVPADEDVLRLARITTPLIRFLHPEIVYGIVEDNERHRQEWSAHLADHGIDPRLYLWERSPCAFPGIRRYSGSKEIAAFRGHATMDAERPENALRLDDNDFPKQVWSFVFRGRKFAKHGPKGYALAHLADHKSHGNRYASEFTIVGTGPVPSGFPGLYTSAANTVYMPVNLIRPTDFSKALRNLLLRKAVDLYGSFCNLLPPSLAIPEPLLEIWSVDAFHWTDPVGSTENMNRFLDFRNETLNQLLTEPVPAGGSR